MIEQPLTLPDQKENDEVGDSFISREELAAAKRDMESAVIEGQQILEDEGKVTQANLKKQQEISDNLRIDSLRESLNISSITGAETSSVESLSTGMENERTINNTTDSEMVERYVSKHETVERLIKKAYAESVVYHKEDGAKLADTKIAFVRTLDGKWVLPKRSIDPDKNERSEAKDSIEEATGLNIDVEAKLGETKEEMIEGNTTLEVESKYFLARSSTDKIPSRRAGESEVKWFTLKDIVENTDIRLNTKQIKLIKRAMGEI
ncbi:MAG: hypothetical protein WCO48_01775 [Candidatus Taylorbacteria bacterium]